MIYATLFLIAGGISICVMMVGVNLFATLVKDWVCNKKLDIVVDSIIFFVSVLLSIVGAFGLHNSYRILELIK